MRAGHIEARSRPAGGKQITHALVGESLYAAVSGVVDHEPLPHSRQLVRYDQEANGVVARAAVRVANSINAVLGQPGLPGRLEPGVQAGEDREPPATRHRQPALVTKNRRAIGIRGQHVFKGPAF